LWLVLALVFRRQLGWGAVAAGIAGIALFAYGVIAIYGFNFVGS
jgi:hypothetical protein